MQALAVKLRQLVYPFVFGGLILSYVPYVSFGRAAGLHLEVSLLYIIVTLFVIISLPNLRRSAGYLWKNTAFRLLLALAAYETLSILWSSNLDRALFTTAFSWLLVGLVASLVADRDEIIKRERLLGRVVAWSIIVMCVVALWQVFGDALGVPPSLLLVPSTYQSAVFGVARPVGFAAEPQFLGSLLLFPLLFVSWKILKITPSISLVVGEVLLATCLTLTLSRGALLAAAVGLITLVIFSRPSWKNLSLLIGTGLSGVILAFTLIYSAAAINQRDSISGSESIAKTINQLSLGAINIPSPSSVKDAPRPVTHALKSQNGYVSSSTTSRVSMVKNAMSLWLDSPLHTLFGVGIGGFGASLHEQKAGFPVGSVVNNYFVEMLAELGLVGISLFLGLILVLFAYLIRNKLLLPIALLLAYLIQWWFFSGNANVIHIWVVLAIIIYLYGSATPGKSWRHLIQ